MNKFFLWFMMACKRQAKRPFFLLLLLLIPVGLGLFGRAEKSGSDRISIALYTDGDRFNEQVARTLAEDAGAFAFYLCGTREELERDVAAKKAECGYVFPAGLKEMLDRKEYRRKISVVAAPSTVVSGLASEAVFAGLFQVYGRELLRQYAEESEIFAPLSPAGSAGRGGVWEELEPLYDRYLENGSTFAFEYGTVSGGDMETASVKAVFPVRGIAAVFVFVIGLSAAVTAAADEQRGLFRSLASGKRTVCILAQLAAPILFTCASAFLCLLVSGELREPVRDLAALAGYGLAVLLFSCLLERLFRNPLLLSGLIPFFIIGSLTACPVFADLSALVPVLKTVRLFFLPYYYLIL